MLDNKNFLIGVILITMLLGVGILQASIDVSNKVSLDTDSSEFLSQYNTTTVSNGLSEFEAEARDSQKDKHPFLDKLEGLPIISDVLGMMTYLVDATKGVYNFIKFIFNIPSFLISGIGLPIGAFGIYLNISGFALTVGIIIFLARLVK